MLSVLQEKNSTGVKEGAVVGEGVEKAVDDFTAQCNNLGEIKRHSFPPPPLPFEKDYL